MGEMATFFPSIPLTQPFSSGFCQGKGRGIGGSPLLLNGDQDFLSTGFAMSQTNAAEFLRKLDTDTAIRTKVAEAYRRLLIETGREAGLEFTSEELKKAVPAFRQESFQEISDADLAIVAGGQGNYSFGGGYGGGGGQSNQTLGPTDLIHYIE
jgi:predicted ribosomally synthesized peptide with nif11-like leader